MVRRRNCCEFCSNINRTTEWRCCLICKSNLAFNNCTVDVYNRSVTHICNRDVFFFYEVVTIIFPYSYRNTYKSIINSLCIFITYLLNSYCKKFRKIIINKFSLEAVCNNNTICFPSVCTVEF